MGSRLVGILTGVGGYLFGARQSVTSSREKVGRKVGKPTLSTQVFDIIGCVAETESKRKHDARSGGEMKPKANLAASVIADHAHFIQTKKAEGARKSDVINWVNTFRLKASLEIAGRSEMYRQLTASGLWD